MISIEKKTQILEYDAVGMKLREIRAKTGFVESTISRILNNYRRIVVIGDGHSGHIAGITPPKWQTRDEQAEVWDWYYPLIRTLNPDVLFVLGDMIEGKGKRSGSTELITADRMVQVEMATEVIDAVGCDEITMIYRLVLITFILIWLKVIN